MRLIPVALLALGGTMFWAWYRGGMGTAPGSGTGTAPGSGTGTGTPPANGPGSAPADIRPLAASGNAQWIAVADSSGTRQTYDEWAWFWNSIRTNPLTGTEMDRILGGNNRNTPLLASQWWAAVTAAGLAPQSNEQRSVWTT